MHFSSWFTDSKGGYQQNRGGYQQNRGGYQRGGYRNHNQGNY